MTSCNHSLQLDMTNHCITHMNANVNARCMCDAKLRFRVADNVYRPYSGTSFMHAECGSAMRTFAVPERIKMQVKMTFAKRSGWQKIPRGLIRRALQPETLCYRRGSLIRPQWLQRFQHGCGSVQSVSGHDHRPVGISRSPLHRGILAGAVTGVLYVSSRLLLWSPRANPVACGF
jgi:hypothetical protein